MIYSAPYRYVVNNSAAFRRAIFLLSSEQWSCLGFICLALTAFAGYFRHIYAFGILLFIHQICDLTDGYVYRTKEHGMNNGYGLYIDHILDSIGAAFVVFGGYFFIPSMLFPCALGLVLYYLLAIHSWLYKINKISSGQLVGAYYGIAVPQKITLWVSVDDLTIAVTIIAFSRSLIILYLTDTVLFVTLAVKIAHAITDLRTTRWLPQPTAIQRSLKKIDASRG